MPSALEIFYRSANVLLGGALLMAAAFVVAEIARNPTTRREPLGIVLCFVLIAVGVRATVRGLFEDVIATRMQTAWTITVIDWLAAGAAVALLALRRRYGLFIESAKVVREYETVYAAKAEEARSRAKDKQEVAAVEAELSSLAAQLAAIRKLRKK